MRFWNAPKVSRHDLSYCVSRPGVKLCTLITSFTQLYTWPNISSEWKCSVVSLYDKIENLSVEVNQNCSRWWSYYKECFYENFQMNIHIWYQLRKSFLMILLALRSNIKNWLTIIYRKGYGWHVYSQWAFEGLETHWGRVTLIYVSKLTIMAQLMACRLDVAKHYVNQC